MTHYPIFLPRAAKRSCFALSSNTCLDELNSRLRTMDRVQPLFFKCLSSDAIIIFAFFIVYFGVEMFEQSVKLSWLIIIFYFINKFLFYAPLSPNREPKTSAFRSVFVFRAVFSPSIVVSVAKGNTCATNTSHYIAIFARNWSI